MDPDDDVAFEKMWEEYYHRSWGANRERRLQSKGTSALRSQAPYYLSYWRIQDRTDLEGTVAHRLGHSLADMHYNAGRRNGIQDWLQEAVGYHLSFEYLGRNSVTCFAF